MSRAESLSRRLLLQLFLTAAALSPALAKTTKADRLFKVIDSLDVENNWPAGVHVDWKTGQPDGKPEKLPGHHTHCSAFVAAAAMKLGVYILRPPEHSQVLLANAQYDWLSSDGAQQGWRPLADAAAAQDAANRGDLVVVVYHNIHDDKPGHIAIVRPSSKDRGTLAADGPDVTQAGGRNYTSTTFRVGFAGHPRALQENGVLYFAHAVDASQIP